MFRTIASRLPRRVVFGLLALALVATAVAGGFAGQAGAAPDHIIIFNYYSDASMTNLVGVRAIGCDGSTDRWGRVTQYIDLETEPCF